MVLRNSTAPLVRAAILVVVVACLAIVLACGDDDGDEAAITPTASPTSNGGKEGPLSLTLVLEPEPHLTWVATEGASSYHVTGTVEYGATCEAQEDGVTDSETVELDETLDATESEFALPPPEDGRLGLVIEGQITIESDNGVQDGVAYTGDPICQ